MTINTIDELLEDVDECTNELENVTLDMAKEDELRSRRRSLRVSDRSFCQRVHARNGAR